MKTNKQTRKLFLKTTKVLQKTVWACVWLNMFHALFSISPKTKHPLEKQCSDDALLHCHRNGFFMLLEKDITMGGETKSKSMMKDRLYIQHTRPKRWKCP